MISKSLILICSIFIISCAVNYRPIDPPTINNNSHDFQDGIGISYKYDVL